MAGNPAAKHAILDVYARHGLVYPNTPVMALHRGGSISWRSTSITTPRCSRGGSLIGRSTRPRLGCRDPLDATVGTPLDGTTLLHMCVEYDELEIARWLLDRGMNVNLRATVGRSGSGGQTALFHTVVSQPNFWMNYRDRGPFVAPFAELLLAHGADPNVRASPWKRLHPGHGAPARHEYLNVTALSWGRRFHAPVFVSAPAMRLIEAAGGVE
jgi:hypothetical protein